MKSTDPVLGGRGEKRKSSFEVGGENTCTCLWWAADHNLDQRGGFSSILGGRVGGGEELIWVPDRVLKENWIPHGHFHKKKSSRRPETST